MPFFASKVVFSLFLFLISSFSFAAALDLVRDTQGNWISRGGYVSNSVANFSGNSIATTNGNLVGQLNGNAMVSRQPVRFAANQTFSAPNVSNASRLLTRLAAPVAAVDLVMSGVFSAVDWVFDQASQDIKKISSGPAPGFGVVPVVIDGFLPNNPPTCSGGVPFYTWVRNVTNSSYTWPHSGNPPRTNILIFYPSTRRWSIELYRTTPSVFLETFCTSFGTQSDPRPILDGENPFIETINRPVNDDDFGSDFQNALSNSMSSVPKSSLSSFYNNVKPWLEKPTLDFDSIVLNDVEHPIVSDASFPLDSSSSSTSTTNANGDDLRTDVIKDSTLDVLKSPASLSVSTVETVLQYLNDVLTSESVNTSTADAPLFDGEFPVFCSWATVICDFIDWFKDDSAVSEVDLSNFVMRYDDISVFDTDLINDSGASCPTPLVLDLAFFNTSVSFDYAVICEFLSFLKIFITISSYIFSVVIILRA